MSKSVPTGKAAKLAGINPATLYRWIQRGEIRPPKTVIVSGRATRLWTAQDIARLRKQKEAIYRKGRGRKAAARK